MNHGLLCCAKGCELWRVILSQWLSIMVCYTKPVDVNHGDFTVPVVVNNDVSYRVSGCELCCAILVNHGELY